MSRVDPAVTGMIETFRATGGKLSGPAAGAPVLLLTTTGKRSDLPRTSPMTYSVDGDDLVVTAANGGQPAHPHWYHNLVANPVVIVEIPGETFAARAIVTEGAERDRLFRLRASERPNFAKWQQQTDRQFPLIRLRRVEQGADSST
jgi:deazaflavin-dependent oxidoreductase (nitroreductase family)